MALMGNSALSGESKTEIHLPGVSPSRKPPVDATPGNNNVRDNLRAIIEERQAPGAKTVTHRRAMGWAMTTDPDFGTTEYETLMCMHCQYHWQIQPGSGIRRGWCMNCGGPTCGKKRCETSCKHFEKVVEEIEAAARMAANLRVLTK